MAVFRAQLFLQQGIHSPVEKLFQVISHIEGLVVLTDNPLGVRKLHLSDQDTPPVGYHHDTICFEWTAALPGICFRIPGLKFPLYDKSCVPVKEKRMMVFQVPFKYQGPVRHAVLR